jgi:hypothetical protein
MVERGPQVPLVSKPRPFACRGERLARAGSSPHRAILWPSGEAQREAPPSDPGEEVALGETTQLVGADVFDGSFVHNSGWYVLMAYEFTKPCRCAWVVFVVEVHTSPFIPGCAGSPLPLLAPLIPPTEAGGEGGVRDRYLFPIALRTR